MGLKMPPRESRDGLRRAPLLLGFVWGFAEATLFFVIPDVIIGWAALSSLRGGLWMLASATAGAAAGGLVLYAAASAHPAAALAAVEAVPFVRPAMIERVEHEYRRQGAFAILFGPGNGIPYKIYAVLAPPVAGPVSFALLSIPARLERFLAAWLIFTVVGQLFRRAVRLRPRRAALIFAGAWAVGYAVYWSLI